MGVLSRFLGLFGIQTAKQITIDKLSENLVLLQNGQTEADFIGITSNGIDCIYFVQIGGEFQIEFEAATETQIPFIEKLKAFAVSNSYGFSTTRTEFQLEYTDDENAPVICIETNSDFNRTAEVAALIQQTVFQNNDRTVYEIVP